MDWNLRYAEGDTPWDKGGAHPVLRDMLVHKALTGRVLVPGCGSGHDVRALTRLGLDVVGLDVASLAIDLARNHPSAGSEGYVHGDLFDLPDDLRGSFDGVFEHTCFCAIDPSRRTDYARAVASALKPGGRLLGVFYTDPGNEDDGPPHGVTAEELDGFFRRDFRLLEEYLELPTFPGREGCELLRLLERL